MQNTLSGFLAENAIKTENVKVVPSERFVDPGTKKPYEWEMRPLGAKEQKKLRKQCLVPKKGKKGEMETDNDKFIAKALASSVVFPDLRDAELQNSYGVMGEAELLEEMLLSAEYVRLLTEFNKLNGFDDDMEEMVGEAED